MSEVKKWAVFNYGAEIQMTEDQANSAYHSGQCDNDVRALSEVPEIKAQLDKIGHTMMARELRDWGTWSDEELSDRDATRQRFLWVAAADIVEGRND